MSSGVPRYHYIMWWYDLRQILSLLDQISATRIAMTHLLSCRESQQNPFNQSIPKKTGYLNHGYNHNSHFEGISSCSMDLHFSEQLRKWSLWYVKQRYITKNKAIEAKELLEWPLEEIVPKQYHQFWLLFSKGCSRSTSSTSSRYWTWGTPEEERDTNLGNPLLNVKSGIGDT